MDVSGTEQLSLCIRYVDIPDLQAPVLREDFVGFIPINDQSSENLANVILQRCDELNLDMTKCVGCKDTMGQQICRSFKWSSNKN
ncbi:hypothetical protein TNCT_285231 [Trichonephila clavata]|uniref:Uncharacterized protein n=1 Tax=Trichonephila clavata TaxID=2740835 RepID=A0A8X6LFP7_TRICU|nr:hypothetical protein TNCT_285231 [Trichonephila clavata]